MTGTTLEQTAHELIKRINDTAADYKRSSTASDYLASIFAHVRVAARLGDDQLHVLFSRFIDAQEAEAEANAPLTNQPWGIAQRERDADAAVVMFAVDLHYYLTMEGYTGPPSLAISTYSDITDIINAQEARA